MRPARKETMNATLPVTIVIVSYNCRPALQACLLKLTAEGDTPPILVVDNASTDDTAEMVARDFPEVQLLQNTGNYGFAAACNQGIRASASDFILLLNPDTLLKRAALQKLTDTMRAHPNIGACGPRVLNTDGSLQPSCRRFPTLGAMICDELGLGRLFARSRRLAKYRMHGWEHDENREVDQLMGSCLLLRRQSLEHIGLLDERFFLYFEEVDLCRRLQQTGSRTPRSRILAARAAKSIHTMRSAIVTAACLPSIANTIPPGNCRFCGSLSKSPRLLA
jgi:GT2 family glycosyltransferase